MSIYRRGRIYWIELTSHGERIRESSGTTDKKQAQEYHEKRKGELWRQAKLGEPPPVTWGEAVKKWLSIQPRGMPDRYRIRKLPFSLGSSLPLTTGEIEGALASCSSAGSHNRTLALIVAIHNAISASPPELQRRSMPPGRTRWLTAEEWQRLKKALAEESQVLHDAAEFAVATGLRENNVLELEWDRVDLRRRTAWFYADQMKGGTPHGIPLNDAACAVLEARRGIHKKYVFPNIDTGLPYTKASNRAWYAALKKAKLKGVRWHDLRHTFAAWAVMNGVRLEELMKLGHWKTYSMVLRYAHLAPEHLAESAAKIKPVSLKQNWTKRQ